MSTNHQAPHRKSGARMLAASAALLATTLAVSSAPLAQATLTDDNFLSALSGAGINIGDPGSAVSLGQSLCPMVEDAGQPLSSVVSSVLPALGGLGGLGGLAGGLSPGMAGMFTSIALSMYCPQVVDSITSGNTSSLPQIPGVPGISDLSGLAGLL